MPCPARQRTEGIDQQEAAQVLVWEGGAVDGAEAPRRAVWELCAPAGFLAGGHSISSR